MPVEREVARRGRWAVVVGGGLVAAAVALNTAGMVIRARVPERVGGSDLEHFLLLAVFAAFLASGAVVVARKPRHAVGWLLVAVGGLPTLAQPFVTWGEHIMTTTGEPDLATVFGFWMNAWYWPLMLAVITCYLPLLFPDGRLPSRRWRPVLWIVTASVAVLVVLGMFQPTLTAQDVQGVVIDNPIGIAGLPHSENSPLASVPFLGLLGGLAGGIASVVVRYRRSRGVERQQLKWFLFAVALLPLLPLGELIETAMGVAPDALGAIAVPIVFSGLPVSIGVAVLRYKLWDIDRIISRTLAYVLVVASLAALYLGSVVGLGAAARALTGESGDLVVALSTLVVAALFQPLRRRVQGVVDRRFNRPRVDAVRTLDAFANSLRDEVGLDAVVAGLRQTAAGVFHPSHAGVLLLEPERPRR